MWAKINQIELVSTRVDDRVLNVGIKRALWITWITGIFQVQCK